jgi:Co/Zn/Cd efflux system component
MSLKHINFAVTCTVILGVVLFFMLYDAMTRNIFDLEISDIPVLVLVAGSTYGIYKKSRLCSIAIFLCLVFITFVLWFLKSLAADPNSVDIAILVCVAAIGVSLWCTVALFNYHKYHKQEH